MTTRDATDADLAAIVAIYNSSIPGGQATADTRPIAVESRRDWFAAFDPSRRPIWVADDNGTIAGCIYLSWFVGGRPAYDKTAEVSTYIAPAYQRTGLGTRLKRELIRACPRFGVEHLLSIYFEHNEATARLNRRFGFEVVGRLPNIAEIAGKPRSVLIAHLTVANATGLHD